MPILSLGEEIVNSEYASYNNKSGILTLTNKRIIFESQSGTFSKQTYTNLDVGVSAIEDVRVEGQFSKKLCVLLKHGNYPPRFEFGVSDLEKWKGMLIEASKSAQAKAEQPSSGTPIKEVITREIVKIPCRYCGMLVAITESNCNSCGAPLQFR